MWKLHVLHCTDLESLRAYKQLNLRDTINPRATPGPIHTHRPHFNYKDSICAKVIPPEKRDYRVRREKAVVHSGGIPARELVRSTR